MQECDAQQAIEKMNRWRSQSLPVSALSHVQQTLYIRLSGTEHTVQAGRAQLGGEVLTNDTLFWRSLGEHQHDFFSGDDTLWRLSVNSKTSPLNETCLIEWGGGVQWVRGGTAKQRQTWADYHGGHATLFRGKSEDGEVFQPLSSGLLPLHQNLKSAFDPSGILNPQRMYAAY
jgi:glycolate oxidase FAD binding subunit